MTPTSYSQTSAEEVLQIHHATCRARRQGLVCGTCTELAERAARVITPLAEVA